MIGRLLSWLADRLIQRALRTPYFHLHHADGSLYMERFWLIRSRWLTARVHHICTRDFDRHLHDHPWGFVSLVLKGSYIELRPAEIEPRFNEHGHERTALWPRTTGSIAFRRPTDRHLVDYVEPGTWTLFIAGPKRHWWGFYTPAGKVHWQDYESVHNNAPIGQGG